DQLHIGHLLAGTLQHSGQAHSKCKVPILGKILRTKQWRRKKQDNKKKNRTAYRFHFRISYELLRTWNQGRISLCGHFLVWSGNRHSRGRILCRDQANTLLDMPQMGGNIYERNPEEPFRNDVRISKELNLCPFCFASTHLTALRRVPERSRPKTVALISPAR